MKLPRARRSSTHGLGGGGTSSMQGLGGSTPIINARSRRRGADHQRKTWKAGERTSTQGLRGMGPIINARPGRRRPISNARLGRRVGRSSTRGLGGGKAIINAEPWRQGPIINARPGRRGGRSSTQGGGCAGTDHQRKAWEAEGRSSTQGLGGERAIITGAIITATPGYLCAQRYARGSTPLPPETSLKKNRIA